MLFFGMIPVSINAISYGGRTLNTSRRKYRQEQKTRYRSQERGSRSGKQWPPARICASKENELHAHGLRVDFIERAPKKLRMC